MFQRKKLLLPETPAEVEFKNCNVTTIGERCFSQKILKREFILMMGMWLDCDPIYFSNNPQILSPFPIFTYFSRCSSNFITYNQIKFEAHFKFQLEIII